MVYETKTATRRGNLREALIAAAERAIETQGLSGLKARALAAEAGCAVGAIYNVVADLDELVLAVNARTLAALERLLAQAVGSREEAGGDVEAATDRLKRLARAYLDFAAAHTKRWRALFDHRMPEGRAVPDWYMADQQRLFDYVEGPLTALQPGLAPRRRALVARSLFSAVHGIVVLGLEEKLQPIPLSTLREQLALMVTALAKGLTS
jgi:AcrR family transcriptional regulator